MSVMPEQREAGQVHCLTQNLKLSLACPECGARTEIPWERLASGMRCPECNCCFVIGQGGHLESQRNATRIRFTCPRCGFMGTLRSQSSKRDTECAGCGLPLFAGQDRGLHGPEEMAEIRQKARQAAKNWTTGNRPASVAPPRWPPMIVAGALAACGLVLAVALRGWFFADDSARGTAHSFTLACLGDQWEPTSDEVIGDDQQQQMVFRQWRIMNFASIRDGLRPAGDRVRLDVTILKGDAEQQTLRITVKSSFLGERSHVQCWQRQEAGWRFDAAASLRDSASGQLAGGPLSPDA